MKTATNTMRTTPATTPNAMPPIAAADGPSCTATAKQRSYRLTSDNVVRF